MNDFKVGDLVRHKASGDHGPIMSIHLTGAEITCIY
jgi:hypothetical protein